MTREIALHCMKSYSESHSDLCELCPIYGQTGSDHCFEDALEYVIKALEQEPKVGHWICDGKGRNFADYHCSECGLKLALCGQDIKQRQDSGYSLFCGGCGADMREVDE